MGFYRLKEFSTVVIAVMLLSFSAYADDGSGDRLIEAARSTSRPIIVDFGKGQCTQCILQSKAIEEVKARLGGKVGFEFVHVIEEASLTGRYQIFMIPTLVFLNASGKEIYRYVGLLEADDLQEKIEELWF